MITALSAHESVGQEFGQDLAGSSAPCVLVRVIHSALSAGGWAGLENSRRLLRSHSVHSYSDTSVLLHLASHRLKLRLPYSMLNSE